MTLPPRADHSLEYNSLTYADPTGNQAVRNLAPGHVSITWPDGSTVWIDERDTGILAGFLRRFYTLRMSRKARLWATRKQEKTPGLYQQNEGPISNTRQGEN